MTTPEDRVPELVEDRNFIAGGVNSPMPVPDGYPKYVLRGDGARIVCDDGRTYVDLCMAFGAALRGHRDPVLEDAARGALGDGWLFSIARTDELRLARLIHDSVPCAERVRFAATGSEATMYAVRAARAATGRTALVAVRGGYHGSILATVPSPAGLPKASRDDVEFVQFNNLDDADAALRTRRFAALILEPVQANNGCVPPRAGYLDGLRRMCSSTGTILIFDEIVTGFRLGKGGAQAALGVVPDICTLSKAMSGGFPLSAICGRRDILDNFIPNGSVFFGGTYYAHPVSLRVAVRNLETLQAAVPYDQLAAACAKFRSWLETKAAQSGLRLAVQGIGSMLSIGLGVNAFTHGLSEESYDAVAFDHLVRALAQRGVLHPPLATETMFLSPRHLDHLDELKSAFEDTFEVVADSLGR